MTPQYTELATRFRFSTPPLPREPQTIQSSPEVPEVEVHADVPIDPEILLQRAYSKGTHLTLVELSTNYDKFHPWS
ncbi:MAG: hypothetical protein RIT18_1291 [Actinomycetota bacterium]